MVTAKKLNGESIIHLEKRTKRMKEREIELKLRKKRMENSISMLKR